MAGIQKQLPAYFVGGKPRPVFQTKTSYHLMSWSLKPVGLEDFMFVSLRNLTGNPNTDQSYDRYQALTWTNDESDV